MNSARIRNAVLGAAVFLSTTCAGAMTPEEIVEREKSMLKALEIYDRY